MGLVATLGTAGSARLADCNAPADSAQAKPAFLLEFQGVFGTLVQKTCLSSYCF
jgi:hypothetical protein